jgi:hypothetical protein
MSDIIGEAKVTKVQTDKRIWKDGVEMIHRQTVEYTDDDNTATAEEAIGE